ncbi:hypothetical protein [Vallitalea okinawensis]|uniref:hypothetical protein n=1 Tax=Vallitalea okinawensis TaxID=2078660 RepID=UPI000CFAB4F5|nr:hypothetical protein [Vallitalea okinawensis]
MDFGTILDIVIVILLAYALIKKVLGWMNLKQYEKEGAVVFRHQSKKLMVTQYVSLALSVVFTVLYINGILQGTTEFTMAFTSFILFFFYFGFLPTSSGYWALTKKGVYLYLYDRYIKWPELITIGFEQKKTAQPDSPYFMSLIVKKNKGELFKQTNYRCLVPAEDKKTVEDFVNGERKKVDRIKLRRKSKPYYEELKKGKRNN